MNNKKNADAWLKVSWLSLCLGSIIYASIYILYSHWFCLHLTMTPYCDSLKNTQTGTMIYNECMSGISLLLILYCLLFQFKCCGVTNKTDWYDVLNGTLPSSCCSDGTDQCVNGWSEVGFLYIAISMCVCVCVCLIYVIVSKFTPASFI